MPADPIRAEVLPRIQAVERVLRDHVERFVDIDHDEAGALADLLVAAIEWIGDPSDSPRQPDPSTARVSPPTTTRE